MLLIQFFYIQPNKFTLDINGDSKKNIEVLINFLKSFNVHQRLISYIIIIYYKFSFLFTELKNRIKLEE